DYQLPNFTAHNETCANIGNVLWNYRMLQVTGDAKYADVMELALYNSVLSGISLNGKNFLYTNPLAQSDNLPFKQRWSKDRVPYIGLSNCCPPNVVRTIAEVSNYAYSIAEKGIWFNLYGANNIKTQLSDGSKISLNQATNYPWDGNVKVTVNETVEKAYSMFFRIPGWASDAKIMINGKQINAITKSGTYAEVNRTWKAGDVVELILPMETQLIESNPLVEENRNQIAVKRGPMVYCLESTDFNGENIFNAVIPSSIGPENTPVARASGKGIIMLLSVLCLVFLASTIYLYWLYNNHPATSVKPKPLTELTEKRNTKEIMLQDTLNKMTGQTLILTDSLFSSPIILHEPLQINKDTVYIR
ncbi:MAG: hypothetical protein EOO07_37075, partial [Chitinophagaceae bacterium]